MNPQDILAQVMGTRSGKRMSPPSYPRNHPLDPATPQMPMEQVDQLQQLMMQMGIGGHGGDGDFIGADQVRQAGADVAGADLGRMPNGAELEMLASEDGAYDMAPDRLKQLPPEVLAQLGLAPDLSPQAAADGQSVADPVAVQAAFPDNPIPAEALDYMVAEGWTTEEIIQILQDELDDEGSFNIGGPPQ